VILIKGQATVAYRHDALAVHKRRRTTARLGVLRPSGRLWSFLSANSPPVSTTAEAAR
jgi:hypothetical protein